MRRAAARAAVVTALVACGGGRREPPPDRNRPLPIDARPGAERGAIDAAAGTALDVTPNALLGTGVPTLIVGTLGDERADRMIATQAALLRSVLPGARIVADTSIDVAAGPAAWPATPVLYGGAHMNAVIAALAPSLPLVVDAERVAVGGVELRAHGDRVIAAIPARAADASGPGYPAFVLYAGTGTPGVVEINGLRHGGESILLADAFGRLRTGRWIAGADGTAVGQLDAAVERIAWRTLERTVGTATIRVAMPASGPPRDDDEAIADAVARGVATAGARLSLTAPPALTIYVHADRRRKEAITGEAGDGHALAAARALHVVRFPAPQLERLLVHEATHALVGDAWGPAGTPALGEGLAVWVADGYRGERLDVWAARMPSLSPAADLLPPRGFRSRPEAESYPLAGMLVEAAVAQVGLAGVRDHLYAATADDWDAACERAGTTTARLDAAVAARR